MLFMEPEVPLSSVADSINNADTGLPQPGSKRSLEQTISYLNTMLVSVGFPEAGNLKSSKAKEIKVTLKCFSEIIKQRQADLDFKSSVGENMAKAEQQIVTLTQKNQLMTAKNEKLARKLALQTNEMSAVNMKSKDKNVKNQYQKNSDKKIINDLKTKLTMMKKEVKRKETEFNKCQEQLRLYIEKQEKVANMQNYEPIQYQNPKQITKDVNDEEFLERLYKHMPESEMLTLQKKGFEKNYDDLIQYNEDLKLCLLKL